MNSRDYGKKLNNIYQESEAKINAMKEAHENAQELLQKIEDYFNQAEQLNDKITDEETGLQAILDSAQELESNINTAKSSADAELQKIVDALASVQSNIEEMETSYKTFTELNDKITDEETGLQAILDSAQELESNINTAKSSADAELQKIVDALASVQSNIEEMETSYKTFTELNDKITDEETGLQAILDQSSELKKEIISVKSNAERIYKEILSLRDNAAERVKDIDNYKTNANNTAQEIQAKYDESVEFEKKIQEIFDIGAKGAHANYFVERRNQLRKMCIIWMIIALLMLSATVLLARCFIVPLSDRVTKDGVFDLNLSVLLLRLSVLTPTAFGLVYALKQYSQERRLHEKYAFKAISTYSLETSLKTLTRTTGALNDPSRDKKIVDLAVRSFSSIYQEPVENKKESWSFGAGNKLLKLTAETNQTVGKIYQEVDQLADQAKGGVDK